MVRRASGEGLQASKVEVSTDAEEFDTASQWTITVIVRNYLGQVSISVYRAGRQVLHRARNDDGLDGMCR